MTEIEENDPHVLGWMQGFPPPRDKRVRYLDGSYYAWPQLRWSFCHIDELMPTKIFWSGKGAALDLEYDLLDFEDVKIETESDGVLDWAGVLKSTCTDGLLITHKDRVVYEQYFGACNPDTRHLIQSSNKSFVGTLAELLIHDGRLDPDALVPDVIPELENTAWKTATIRHVMNMQVSMNFHEDYQDPLSDIWRFMRATGMAPPRSTDSSECIADVLPNIAGDGEHGKVFAYREPNIFVLGWIVRRVAGKDLATLLSECVWQQIGAEHDGYYLLDSSGAETSCCVTLRDFVRFGCIFTHKGKVGERQLVPRQIVESLFQGGDLDVFARGDLATYGTWSYKSQWWIRHLDGRQCLAARGAHGQLLYIDNTNDLIIARFGSARMSSSSLLDGVIFPMIDAITEYVTAA